jgi:hypothetical protein
MSGRTARAAGCTNVSFPATEQCAFLLSLIKNVIRIIEKVYAFVIPIVMKAEAKASVTINVTDDKLIRVLYPKAYNVPYPSEPMSAEDISKINAIRTILKIPLI